jgi:aminoglycoside phosphotransferase (APT) family kinase protein
MKEALAQITESAFGSSYTNAVPIVGKGKSNQVFKVEIDNRSFIFRLSKGKEQLDLYKKEKLCAEKAQESGVKTPSITHIGCVEEWTYSIQEFIEGTLGTEANEKEVWFKLGQVAKQVHQIPANEIAINYRQKLHDLFSEDHFLEHDVITEETQKAIVNRLQETINWEFSPKLCHGNFWPNNVILAKEGSVWLIDWGTATGNWAPVADLADIYTWKTGKNNIATFCDGYGLSNTEVQTMMRDIQTLVLLRLLGIMRNWIVGDGGTNGRSSKHIEEVASRLRSIDSYDEDILFTRNLN